MKFKISDNVRFTRPNLKWSIEKQHSGKTGKVVNVRDSNYTYDIEILFEGDPQSVWVKSSQLELVTEEPAGIEHTQQEVPIEEYDYDQITKELAEDLECTPEDIVEYAHNSVGLKYDQSKPRVDILAKGCPRALLAVGKALGYGAKKYNESPDNLNFLQVEDGFNRYSRAMMGHFLEESICPVDEDSGLDHIVLTAVNALFRLEIYLRGKENGPCKNN